MTTLQFIILILAAFWVAFELLHLILWIRKKIKNKKYEADQGEGRDEREN